MSQGDFRIDGGFRVIGPNTGDGAVSSWYFATEKEAQAFAEQLSREVQDTVEVCKYLGRYRPTLHPVEWIKSEN
jgi:hypothetical protein